MNETVETTELQSFKLELGFKLLQEVMAEIGVGKIVDKDKKMMVCDFG